MFLKVLSVKCRIWRFKKSKMTNFYIYFLCLCYSKSSTYSEYNFTWCLYSLHIVYHTSVHLWESKMSRKDHFSCTISRWIPVEHREKPSVLLHLPQLLSTCRLRSPSLPSPPSLWAGDGWRSSVWTGCWTGAASGSWNPPSAPPRASPGCGCVCPAPPCSPAPPTARRTSGSASVKVCVCVCP